MPTLLFRALDRLHQFGCGHTDVLRFGAGRVWVECLQCGRETCGIVTKLPPARGRAHVAGGERGDSLRVAARSGSRVSVSSAA
jgi:hypothetical protein